MANFSKKFGSFLNKNRPTIMTALGVSGMIFSVVWTVKSTANATHIIDKEKEKRKTDKIPVKDIIKLTWKQYWPVAACVTISTGCLVFGAVDNNKRQAALATAATLAQSSLQEYRMKTKEVIGPKKEQEIVDKISQDKVNKTYDESKNSVVITGNGDSLFYEPISGRYFKSNWNKIMNAANNLNADALGGTCDEITLNDWFFELGLEPTAMGEKLGWKISDRNKLIKIRPTSALTPDKVPCGAIYYEVEPEALY